MNKDARINVDILGHPKTVLLERALGSDGFRGLIALILWTAKHRPDGSLAGFDDNAIETAIGWRGAGGLLIKTMRQVGFIDGEDSTSSIHDWEEHNSWAFRSPERSLLGTFGALCKKYGRDKALRLLRKRGYATASLTAQPELQRSGQPHAPTPTPTPRRRSNTVKPVRQQRAPLTPFPSDFKISDRVRQWATLHSFDRIEQHLESFRLKCAAREYRYADWDAAFMEAIRKDWAGLREHGLNGHRPSPAPPPAPSEAAISASTIRIACTEAWYEISTAARLNGRPNTDAVSAKALAEIGGFETLRGLQTFELAQRGKLFASAYWRLTSPERAAEEQESTQGAASPAAA